MPSLSKFKFLVKDKWRRFVLASNFHPQSVVESFYSSENSIQRIPPTTPMLFLSGADDQIVPPTHMQQLYSISKSEADSNRRFVLFEKGGHSGSISESNDTILIPFSLLRWYVATAKLSKGFTRIYWLGRCILSRKITSFHHMRFLPHLFT
jgi:fermentation-respiration switch protein FrsA (DUF1100 family)